MYAGASRGQKRAVDPLELELEVVVMHLVGVGNRIHVSRRTVSTSVTKPYFQPQYNYLNGVFVISEDYLHELILLTIEAIQLNNFMKLEVMNFSNYPSTQETEV